MAKKEEADDIGHIGLFKEIMSVIFDVHPKQLKRIISVLSNSKDITNVRTHIVRNHAGARAVKYLRLAVEYARHEGSSKHEDDDTDFEMTKEPDIESTARAERPEIKPEEPISKDVEMERRPVAECTFKDYLLELMVSDDPAQAIQDVKRAARNPDRYGREQMRNTVDQQKEIQQAKDDPHKAEKLRINNLKKQMQMQQKKLADKEAQDAREAGVPDTNRRPISGMSS